MFFNWGFQYHESRANDIWSAIPKGIDILVTHGPPHGVLDVYADGARCGCKTLASKVEEIKPKVHIFGHIHYSSGETTINGIHYVNASMMSEAYLIVHQPKVIELNL